MSKYLHCGKWNNNYYYIFFCAIFAFITNYIYGYTFNEDMDEIRINKNKNNHIIINYFFRYLSLILFSFILYKLEFSCKKTNFKNNSKKIIPKESSIKYIYNNSEQNTKNKIVISPMFILLIMIIMVVQEISEDIFYKSKLRALDLWMLELPLLSYLNLKYFKFKIYLHHKLVIYLNLIICGILKVILLIFFIYIKLDKAPVYEFYYKYWEVIPIGILAYLIIMISRAIALTEIKVLIQYKYVSATKLLIIYGIIGTIITTLIGIISTFFDCDIISSSLEVEICKVKYNTNTTYLENYKVWIDDMGNNTNEIFFLIIGAIANCFYRVFYFFIIKNLTAIHIIFSNLSYATILTWFGKFCNDKKFDILVDTLVFVSQIIVFLGFLIYLEMIELDFCNLNYNLKTSIIDRSIEDYDLKNNSEGDRDSNFNNSISSS